MENRVLLRRYRLSSDQSGRPVILHRTPTSTLFRAEDVESGRPVALDLVTSAMTNPYLSRELEIEAAEARQISHLNIPKLYDFGFDGGQLVYITEYCEGKTAAAWVRRHGPLSTTGVLRVGLQVAATIEAMASRGIYHHALNPDNIIFVGDQEADGEWPLIKVFHWLGIAPLFAESGNAQLDKAALYVSPEQLYTSIVDVRSEIYSLGCTMSFLLTGVQPMPVEPGPARNEILSMAKILHGVPRDVRHLIDRMLRLEPDERPQDPVALADSLQACLERIEHRNGNATRFHVPVVVDSREPRSKPPRFFGAKSAAIALGVIILVLAGAVAFPQYFAVPKGWSWQMHSNPRTAGSPNEIASNSSASRDTETQPNGLEAAVDAIRDQLDTGTDSETGIGGEPPPPAEGPIGSPTNEEIAGSSPPLLLKPPETETAASEFATSAEISGGETHAAAAVSPTSVEGGSIAKTESRTHSTDTGRVADTRPEKTSKSPTTTTSHAKRKSKSKSVAKKSSRKRGHSREVTVSRTKAFPEFRYGSSPAKLVGTTGDGRWILSLQSSGRRVIVPPPPEFVVP